MSVPQTGKNKKKKLKWFGFSRCTQKSNYTSQFQNHYKSKTHTLISHTVSHHSNSVVMCVYLCDGFRFVCVFSATRLQSDLPIKWCTGLSRLWNGSAVQDSAALPVKKVSEDRRSHTHACISYKTRQLGISEGAKISV